jgi:hypothetical protein
VGEQELGRSRLICPVAGEGGGQRGDQVGLRHVAQHARHVARLQALVDVAEGEDRLAHPCGVALVVLIELGEQAVADLRRREVEVRAHPVGRRRRKGARRALVELHGERAADPQHRLRRDPAGERDGVGDPARPLPRHPAEERRGLLHREFRQHHRRHLGALELQEFGQLVEFGDGDALPGIGGAAPRREVAQPPRRRRAEPALERLERAVDATREAEPDLVERLDELARHRLERVAIDKPHAGDLFGQLGLHVLGQRREVDLGALRDHQAHEDRGLLPPAQRGDAPAARTGCVGGGLRGGRLKARGLGQRARLDLRQRRGHGEGGSLSNRGPAFQPSVNGPLPEVRHRCVRGRERREFS